MILHLGVEQLKVAKAISSSQHRIVQDQTSTGFVGLPTDIPKCPLEIHEQRNSGEKLLRHVITIALERCLQVWNFAAATDKSSGIFTFAAKKKRSCFRSDDGPNRTRCPDRRDAVTGPRLNR